MTALRPIAVITGDTPAARAVAGATTSLLTAVGRWVEEVPAGAALDRFAAVVVPRGRALAPVRARYGGPLLVIDGDLLDGGVAPGFARLLGGTAVPALDVHGLPVVAARPLPALAGDALGDAPPGVAVRHDGLGYALPLVVTPTLRTVAGFWALARLVEEAVAALVGESEVLYAAPWPRGVRAARALTYDGDGLELGRTLPECARGGRPATLFCCADTLDRLGALGPRHEIAAHGDVHRRFGDPATNLVRIDRMRAAFGAAGLDPRGFSPPNSTYSSALEPLLERFAYVRTGYQERQLAFFPRALGAGVVHSASYYPDFMQRYVDADEYARLLGRFSAWAAATGILAVPCFHPCLFPEPLRRFLDAPVGTVWEATLAELTDWWMHRRRALAAVAREGEGAAPPDVVLARATPGERLAALRPVNGEPAAGPRRRAAARVSVDGRDVRVVPAADGPAVGVDVPLGPVWRPLGWLPARLRRRLARVANKNGVHACLYGELGLAADVVGGALRLPVVAADEPVVVTAPALGRDLRRVAGALVRRLVRLGAASHA